MGARAVILRPKEITAFSSTFTAACEPFLAQLPSR
jgi:hypothetical protein